MGRIKERLLLKRERPLLMTVSEQWPFVLERIDDKAHCQLTVTSMSKHKGKDVSQYGIIPEPLTNAGLFCHLGRWLLFRTTNCLSRATDRRQSWEGKLFLCIFLFYMHGGRKRERERQGLRSSKVIHQWLLVKGLGSRLESQLGQVLAPLL
jgi:hypothetical protein